MSRLDYPRLPRVTQRYLQGRWSALAAFTLTAGLVPGASAQPATRSADGLLVLAAASLADVLPRAAAAWETAGGAAVRFSFDATSRLAPQAAQGAPADLFFAADQEWMTWLAERGLTGPSGAREVARNDLVVVVSATDGGVSGPADLAGVRRLALAGENVPAGRYAREALEASGVWPQLDGRVITGGSVRSALEWVARGEADAGVVYRTDAIAEPRVQVAFVFDAGSHRPVRYLGTVLATSRRPAAAAGFLDFVSGAEGSALFAAAGFSAAQAEAGPSGAPPAGVVPDPGSAIRLSLLVALLATVVGLAPAVGLGWLLARRDFPGKAVLSTLVLAPLVIPPVVTGFLLLSALGGQSPIGRWLTALGLPVPFTLLGAAIAAFVVGLPLYVISIRGAFEAVDPLYEELSWTLGTPPRRTFVRVSLPLALPGIAAGALLAFARSLGEFGATVVLAGNIEGSTRTIALAVYTLLESPSGRETTWVLVGASVALSLAALLGFEALSRRQRHRLEDRHVR